MLSEMPGIGLKTPSETIESECLELFPQLILKGLSKPFKTEFRK